MLSFDKDQNWTILNSQKEYIEIQYLVNDTHYNWRIRHKGKLFWEPIPSEFLISALKKENINFEIFLEQVENDKKDLLAPKLYLVH